MAILKLNLHPAYLRGLLDTLSMHVPDAEVWAYGSRVTGEAHDGSDLDLVLRNPANLNSPQCSLHRLRGALAESDLPILVEVLDWARVPEEFRREIERLHVVLVSPARVPIG